MSVRLTVTGPFGMGGHAGEGEAPVSEGNEGFGPSLAVRGRLALLAANGDQLTGRYVPIDANFTLAPGGNGGTLAFVLTFKAGEACEGPGGHEVT